MSPAEICCVRGEAALPYIDDLARLRIEVFRAFPYLYDGSIEYEQTYLRRYCASAASCFVLAQVEGHVVGAATGMPLRDEAEDFKRPFLEKNIDPNTIFYFGESVLLPAYRGRGIGVRFIEERERVARAENGITHAAFCAVQRPHDHPRRPSDYVPLDAFWKKRGFEPQPHLTTTFSWRDLDEEHESPKPMLFWMKPLS